MARGCAGVPAGVRHASRFRVARAHQATTLSEVYMKQIFAAVLAALLAVGAMSTAMADHHEKKEHSEKKK